MTVFEGQTGFLAATLSWLAPLQLLFYGLFEIEQIYETNRIYWIA